MVKHRYHARLTIFFSLIFLWRIRPDSALPLLQARLTWIQWQILFVKTPKLAGQIRLACTAAVFQAPSNKSRHDAGPLMTSLDCIIIFMENYPVEKKKRRQKRPHCHRKTSFAFRQFLPHTSSLSHRARVSYQWSIPVLLRSWVLLMKHKSSWRLCAISCVQQPADPLTRPSPEGMATDQ